MYHDLVPLWKDLLEIGLKEDGWPWDWTTRGVIREPNQVIKASLKAKSSGIWAAASLVQALPRVVASVTVKSPIQDKSTYQSGESLVELQGNACEMMAIERPFVNLAAFVCGVANQTHALAEKVREACPDQTPRVALTRKTLPRYREICIHGVLVGGGFPHRVGLSAGILIKENHIATAGSIPSAVTRVRKLAPHGLKIEIEVRSEKELKEALQAKVDGVLLDNFSPSEVRSALEQVKASGQSPFIEVSGGLGEANIASYAIPGVHVLSVGGITHSVKAADLSFLVHG